MTDVLTPTPSDSGASLEAEALDAYSQIVVSVAEHIVPSVASLRVAARGRIAAIEERAFRNFHGDWPRHATVPWNVPE